MAARRAGQCLVWPAAVLTYGVGLWVHLLHEATAAAEPGAPLWVAHWLRDASLALPAVAAALGAVRLVARRLGVAAGRLSAAVSATAVFAAGVPVHDALFITAGGHDHGGVAELPLAVHVGRDALAVFPVALLFAMAAGIRPARPHARTTLAVCSSAAVVAVGLPFLPPVVAVAAPAPCTRTVRADVVALDQSFEYNRLGADNPAGMIYALRRDVVATDGGTLAPGNARLRDGKRARPLTLRMNVGDCLDIEFQNLLSETPAAQEQPVTREASIHVNGLQVLDDIADDGSHVGANPSSLVAPGETTTYRLYAEHENTYLLYSMGSATGAEGAGGTTGFGLFGAVNVEPAGSVWYRSQVTRADLDLATTSPPEDELPLVDYAAVYPAGHARAGLPVLAMTQPTGAGVDVEIVHADLNAIVDTRSSPAPPANPNAGDRTLPFREFTVVFQDEAFARQAFPEFTDPATADVLHGVRDAFPINYGAAGAGAEVLANRKGVGPMGQCPDCKYEEFFLTSWAVGDPAMVVDNPANEPGAATQALYPDDPANVVHSYLNDRVKFRNLHAGSKEHHIFHLHAHQWQSNTDEPNSSYLDSQGIGPGAGYSYEIAWGGGGNRNKTAGDAIFHCHFYPHFAQGMWELWRVHDTFERGTPLDADGRPVAGSRALPDGEIVAGTPIPAVVPLPSQPMAPAPGAVHLEEQPGLPGGQVVIDDPTRNVGFPFFIPGVAGHRPPTPPLDLIDDGGLPRHVVVGGTRTAAANLTRDVTTVLDSAQVRYLPEEGTAAEQQAMSFHEQVAAPTATPEGSPATFRLNGRPPARGAPFADPCPGAANRTYKGAVIQTDVVLNRAGWHAPQHRFQAFWRDVNALLTRAKAPEPFVMRLNVGDCAEYQHTNLVPSVYELDDFQIRTPTDVVGQHIHLVKFDVMSADGSGNGFNYEDGTFSPDEVRERIHAIRVGSGCAEAAGPTEECPVAEPHPFFGAGPAGRWIGARTTVQRWYADPLVINGWDNGLGSVFTHDHFGPSTHQIVGLYSTVLIEPAGAVWRHPETGTVFGTRDDGGPTSWRADIILPSPNQAKSHREFYLEFTDFQLAYERGGGLDAAGQPVPDFPNAVNPPQRQEANPLSDLYRFPNQCRNGSPRPCAEAIAADDPGTFTVNYRNEPLGLRVRHPNGTQAPGAAGDLSLAFSSSVRRADPAFNSQPGVYPPLTAGVAGGDPYTPLLRAYQGDRVRIRMQAGGNEEGHNLTVHGLTWLREHMSVNSGWRNSQFVGISEYFILDIPVIPDPQAIGGDSDYLYAVGASVEDLWNGVWGILRAYGKPRGDLRPLPNNTLPRQGARVANSADFREACPRGAPVRTFDVSAVAARDVLPGGQLVYNSRATAISGGGSGPLVDPTGLLYVNTADLTFDPVTGAPNGLAPGVPVEPLIVRAAAGDCLAVTLRNRLPVVIPDAWGLSALPPIIHESHNASGGGITTFNTNDLRPSNRVGLHPQLMAYDVRRANGSDVGLNPIRSVQPGASALYRWYAGYLTATRQGGDFRVTGTPVELGAIGLGPSDPIKQAGKGLVGAVVIEPPGASWAIDPGTGAQATVTYPAGDGQPAGSFREFVSVWQTDVNLRYADGTPVPGVAAEGAGGLSEDSEDSGHKAVNYRTEPLWFRLGIPPHTPFEEMRALDVASVFANSAVGGDPQTPVYRVRSGDPDEVRFRLVVPAGHARNNAFSLHGHAWPRYPYGAGDTQVGSRRIVANPSPATWVGNQEGLGPSSHFDFVIPRAGGPNRVPGDYLYRDQASFGTLQGLWGLLRVEPQGQP